MYNEMIHILLLLTSKIADTHAHTQIQEEIHRESLLKKKVGRPTVCQDR